MCRNTWARPPQKMSYILQGYSLPNLLFVSDSQPVDPDSYIYLLRMRDLKKTQEYNSVYLVHLRFHLKHLFQSTILSSKNANNRELVTSVLGQFS